jgi:hypothetical protein
VATLQELRDAPWRSSLAPDDVRERSDEGYSSDASERWRVPDRKQVFPGASDHTGTVVTELPPRTGQPPEVGAPRF